MGQAVCELEATYSTLPIQTNVRRGGGQTWSGVFLSNAWVPHCTALPPSLFVEATKLVSPCLWVPEVWILQYKYRPVKKAKFNHGSPCCTARQLYAGQNILRRTLAYTRCCLKDFLYFKD